MSNVVNVDFVTKVVEIQVNDTQEESLAARAAINAAARAQEAKDVVVDNLQDSLDAIDEKTETEKTELNDYTEAKKTEIATLGQGYVDSASQKADEANTILVAIRNEYGYPLTAATASAMTDTTKIYVYTGSETGYTFGHWYYHNGTAWTDGGVYNAMAFNTDPTLTISGAAADAKATGDKFNSTNANLLSYNSVNLLSLYATLSTNTSGTVTFTWQNGAVCRCNVTGSISGTSKNGSLVIDSQYALPSYIQAGKTYRIKFSSTTSNVFMRVYIYVGEDRTVVDITGDSILIVPVGCTGIVMFPRTTNATYTFSNDHFDIAMMNELPNEKLEERIDEFAYVPELLSNLHAYNSINLLSLYATLSTLTRSTATFTWQNGAVCRCNVTGSISGTALNGANIIDSQYALPSYIQAGKTYRIKFSSTTSNVFMRVYIYVGEDRTVVDITGDSILIVPVGCTGIVMFPRTTNATYTFSNDHFDIAMMNELPNEKLEEVSILRNKTNFMPFVTARRRNIALILDVDATYNRAFHDVCVQHGVVCGFAIGQSIDFNQNPVERYREWEQNGFEILCHGSYVMDRYGYKGEKVDGEVVYTPITDEEAAELFWGEYDELVSKGFNVNGYVGKNGYVATEYVPILKNIYDYASTDYNHYYAPTPSAHTVSNIVYGVDHPYRLWRYSLETTTLAQAKDAVDAAIQANTSCIFYGHATPTAYQAGNFTPENLDALLTYMESKHIKMISPYDAVKNVFSIRYDDIVGN